MQIPFRGSQFVFDGLQFPLGLLELFLDCVQLVVAVFEGLGNVNRDRSSGRLVNRDRSLTSLAEINRDRSRIGLADWDRPTELLGGLVMLRVEVGQLIDSCILRPACLTKPSLKVFESLLMIGNGDG